MPWKHPLVLGVDLIVLKGGLRGAAAPAADVTPVAIAYRQKFLNLSGASSV
jgi:hypothetical protein